MLSIPAQIRLFALTSTLFFAIGCQDATEAVAPSLEGARKAGFSVVNSKSDQNRFIPDQYIVVFRDRDTEVDARASRFARKYNGKTRHVFKSSLQGISVTMTSINALAAASDPEVNYIEQDQFVTAEGKPSGSSTPLTTQTKATWGLDRIDQVSLPLNGTYTYSSTGKGVNVYIIDSGIRISHVEFGGRATADFSTIDDGFGAVGCYWHGTHVAATVGGLTAGVAKAASIHSVRVLDCNGGGTLSDAIAGLDWVTANRILPAVANISLQSLSSTALDDAVARAIASGVVVVVAAGNNAGDACGYSPADAPNAITVGALALSDQFAAFSNFGACVDIFAPGTYVNSATNTTDRAMVQADGTSMASPFVAGAAALYLGDHPLASPAEVHDSLIVKAAKGQMTLLPTNTVNAVLNTR